MSNPTPQLYIISPESLDDLDDFMGILPTVLQTSGATCFQLRLRGMPTPDYKKIACTMAPVVQDLGVAFVIGDNVAVAQSCGADGVHLETPSGHHDHMTAHDIKSAKSILGDNAIVGASCQNSRDIAMECADAGADYVSFGPVYTSPHKPHLDESGLDIINWWVQMVEIPCVAIGGITVDTVSDIAATGVDFVGVISGIWHNNAVDNAEMFAKILKSG